METKKIALSIFGILLVGILTYGAINSNKGMSGNAILEITSNSKNLISDGILKFSLNSGELIPASSKIIIKNNGQMYEYNLSEIVSDALTEGNYYVDGKSISGEGQGYGVEGVKRIYPKIYFDLEVYQTNSGEKESDLEKRENADSGAGNVNLENPENEADKIVANEQANKMPEEVAVVNTNEEISDDKEKNSNEQESSDISNVQEDNSEQESVNTEELNPIEGNNPQEETSAPEPASEPEASQESQAEEAPITGNIVAGLLRSASNFFLRLTGTGMAVNEFNSKISGEVSFGEEFTYNLEEGQTAKILQGSVKTDNEQLSDNDVKLKIQNNVALITTDYYEEDKGFGKDYIGEEETIEIKLSDLGINLEEGEFNARIVYGEEEIISLSTNIDGNKQNEIAEIPENTTINESEKKIPEEIIEKELSLSEEEKNILVKEFGENISIKATKAELIDDRIIIRYELGNYWYEPSYDEELDKDELSLLMQNDRILWLKDISKKLSEDKAESKELNEYTGEYSI
jgi:hypothetical protein